MPLADPNRPVTGYPAPAQNGHSANPPPPTGTAYPYAAQPPPPLNNYQSYPQNNYPYYPNYPTEDSIRRANCLRRIFAFIIAVIIIFGTITFIVWLVLRPQLPEFRVDSFTMSNFTLDQNSMLSYSSHINLTARNPNKKMTLIYTRMEAMLFYKDSGLSGTSLAPFQQGTRTENQIEGNFASTGTFVERPAANGITWERDQRGNVNFNLRMESRVRYEAKAWRTRWRLLKVFCPDLVLAMPSNRSSGTLSGGAKQCRVGI